jgi:hypothetical protein
VTPQVCLPPALTLWKLPEGVSVTWPKSNSESSSIPQHSTVPLLVTPQVWLLPALTLSKVPDGGVASPEESRPQHSTLPLLVTPQE